MTSLPDDIEHLVTINVTQTRHPSTTMPTYVNVRNPLGRMHPPHPRPTVSLDPRPVVIPILSSVIGFPIIAFAIICALRHRAIRLRRLEHMKKLQSGIRSVTLDIPARDKISFFSGGSSPEISMKEVGDRGESTQTTFAGPPPSRTSILQTTRGGREGGPSSSRNNNHVKFVTPSATLDSSHTMTVEVVLHRIAASAVESIGAGDMMNCTAAPLPESPPSPLRRIECGIGLTSDDSDSPR